MNQFASIVFCVMVLSLSPSAALNAQDNQAASQAAGFTRTEDIIYGRKHGLALTMDVFVPAEKANGRGLIFCASAGWEADIAGVRGDEG